MTNEEKVKEILICEKCHLHKTHICDNCFDKGLLLKIAQWKDEQYNEEKKELLELVNMLPIDETNQTIIEDLKGLLK